jgi:hypothetical protein
MAESDVRRGAGLAQYLKEAFLFRWNLLLFLGGLAAGALSPLPDAILPLVGAAELAYLIGLVSIPRFRAAIDATDHARRRPPLVEAHGGEASERSLPEVLAALDRDARDRFQRLRRRCLEMRHIARGVSGRSGSDRSVEELQSPGLNRLLWVFLKLLRSQQALTRFLDATDEEAIQATLDGLVSRREAAGAAGAAGSNDRIGRSLQDSIATTQLRLDNYRKAASNHEFVTIELDRIESKINAIAEMAVSHQDPDFISSQVDSVAQSMGHAEEAIRELHHITGLTEEMEEPPPILEIEG